MTFRFSGYPDRYKPAFGHMVHPVGRSGISSPGMCAWSLNDVLLNWSTRKGPFLRRFVEFMPCAGCMPVRKISRIEQSKLQVKRESLRNYSAGRMVYLILGARVITTKAQARTCKRKKKLFLLASMDEFRRSIRVTQNCQASFMLNFSTLVRIFREI